MRRTLPIVLLFLCLLECWLLYAGLSGTRATALTDLRAVWNMSGLPTWVALLWPVSIMLCGVLPRPSAVPSHRIVIALAVLGTTYSFVRDLNGWLWSNRAQVEQIEQVNQLAGENGTVLDGFSGSGALRPHTYYYWWINRYSRALMPPNAEEQILEILKQNPPAVILNDEDLQALPQIQQTIQQHYRPTNHAPIWIRQKPREPTRSIPSAVGR